MQKNYIPKNIDIPDVKYENVAEKLHYIIEYAESRHVKLAALCVNKEQFKELAMNATIVHDTPTTKTLFCGYEVRLHHRDIPVGIIEVLPQSDFSYPFID